MKDEKVSYAAYLDKEPRGEKKKEGESGKREAGVESKKSKDKKKRRQKESAGPFLKLLKQRRICVHDFRASKKLVKRPQRT